MNIIIIGATSEIAKEIGRTYANKKNNFLLIGRDSAKLDNLKTDFCARGASQVHTFASDLDKSENYQSIFDFSCKTFEKFDLFILAHGSLPAQLKIENDYNAVENYARTNFVSYISLLTIYAKKFEDQKSGSIAVFTSVAGDRGRRSNYIYGSFKAGIQAYLEGYSARLSRSGVHVLDIRPGMVDTPMTAHLPKGLLLASAPNVASNIVRAISKKQSVLYTPFFWKYIMLIIGLIPRRFFYKVNF